jgi:hypothetical protein
LGKLLSCKLVRVLRDHGIIQLPLLQIQRIRRRVHRNHLRHGVLGLDLVPDLWLDIISSNMDRPIIIAVDISGPYILSKIHVCKILPWSPASKGLEISEWIVDIGSIFRA